MRCSFSPSRTVSGSARHLVLNLQFQTLLRSFTPPLQYLSIQCFLFVLIVTLGCRCTPCLLVFHSICIKCDRERCCWWRWYRRVEGAGETNRKKQNQTNPRASASFFQTQSDGLVLRCGRGLDDALRQPSDPRCAAQRARWHRNRLRGARG